MIHGPRGVLEGKSSFFSSSREQSFCMQKCAKTRARQVKNSPESIFFPTSHVKLTRRQHINTSSTRQHVINTSSTRQHVVNTPTRQHTNTSTHNTSTHQHINTSTQCHQHTPTQQQNVINTLMNTVINTVSSTQCHQTQSSTEFSPVLNTVMSSDPPDKKSYSTPTFALLETASSERVSTKRRLLHAIFTQCFG
jgi:hypothetical protein